MSKQDVIDYVMETPHNTNRAVLEGLVDTAVEESQVQADWDQNDEAAKDYIKNRICYEETGVDKTYTLTPNRNNDTWNFTNGDIPLILGQSATVKSFGGNLSTFVGTVTQDSDGKLCIDATSVIPITIYSNTATYNYSWIGNAGIDYVTVTISSTVVHQIDPKFIPTASPDWNQNDPTRLTISKTNQQSTLFFPPLLKMQSRIKWSKRQLMRYRMRLRNILAVKFQTKN